MPLSLQDFTDEDNDYIQKHNANNAAIESAFNALEAQVVGAVGEGAGLILDVFDRPGLIGTRSYRLDLENYGGGAQITVGYRPTAVPEFGDLGISKAWATVAGEKTLLQLADDVELDASPIVNALPKTIYVGIPSSGTPQLFEDLLTTNVLYVYSFTWNGLTLADPRRLAPILPGYELLRDMVGTPREVRVQDNETDWLSDNVGRTRLTLPGDEASNELAEMSLEVVGGFIEMHNGDASGFKALGDDDLVTLELWADGVIWATIELPASSAPDTVYFPLDLDVVGDRRFVTEVEEFHLEIAGASGADVVSARGFAWGLFVRPILQGGMAKDEASVDQI